ncbi:MAG: tetratricopeptide repeat protein [Planctomycetota bacterium]
MTSAAYSSPDDANRYPRLASDAAVEPHVFLEAVAPHLETRDVDALAKRLNEFGGSSRIIPLLDCSDTDVCKVAALSLGLVGCKACIPALTNMLKNPDAMANQMAEHALWSIWFRGGNEESNQAVAQGAVALNQKSLDEAAGHFSHAIMLDGDFAEAYNQRSIVRYLQERFGDSMADAERATELMPEHFGAWAGLGHCHAHRGAIAEAVRCYREALAINPHLDCVRELVSELEDCPDEPEQDPFGDVT